MDAALRLGPSTPAPVAGILARLCPAAAWHAADRQEARCHERMRRQLRLRIDLFDAGTADICERVEFQLVAIRFNRPDFGAHATLETFASIDPGIERRERSLQRLDFANAATRVGIGEPQFAVRILTL